MSGVRNDQSRRGSSTASTFMISKPAAISSLISAPKHQLGGRTGFCTAPDGSDNFLRPHSARGRYEICHHDRRNRKQKRFRSRLDSSWASSKPRVLVGQFLRLPILTARAFAERACLPEFPSGGLHVGALALEIVVDRPPQAGIRNVVRRVGGVRQIAARELMLALGAGLDAVEPVDDPIFDRLVITDLEMQERMMLDRAPMAAKQYAVADEVDRAGDEALAALCHDQEGLVRHGLPDQRKEFARQVGASPLARAGLDVEREEGVPRGFGEVSAGKPHHLDARAKRVAALAPDGLALARRQGGEEIVEGCEAGIVPMELLVGAHEEAAFAKRVPFRLRHEGDVDRGGSAQSCELDKPSG